MTTRLTRWLTTLDNFEAKMAQLPAVRPLRAINSRYRAGAGSHRITIAARRNLCD
ncbi:Flagellum-specific ATP synthase [Escherichia coli]|nr:Flagellum-specific ATP synthase [Escherichia coli]